MVSFLHTKGFTIYTFVLCHIGLELILCLKCGKINISQSEWKTLLYCFGQFVGWNFAKKKQLWKKGKDDA